MLNSTEPGEYWEELKKKKVFFWSRMYDNLVLNGCALFTRLYHSADQCTFYRVPKLYSFPLSYCLASWFIFLCVPCFYLSECSILYSYWLEFHLADSTAFPQCVKIIVNSIPALQVLQSTCSPSKLLTSVNFTTVLSSSIITQRNIILMCIISL